MSADCVTFTGQDGKNHIISLSHPNNTRIRDKIKEVAAAKKVGADIETLRSELDALADVPAFVQKASGGKVEVRDGVVFYGEEAIHNTLSSRILWGLSEGFDMDPYLAFLGNLMENPSKRAVDELYGFLEACNMGITDDGCLIAYKRVRNDYRDCHSGRFDNSVGQILEMPRNKVDEDKDRTCSYGFHFCSQAYLPHFGSSSGNRIVIVKVNPRDVVAIPADYANAKARCSRYEVIGEYEGADVTDILSHKPVWANKDINKNFRPDFNDDDEAEFEDGACGYEDEEEFEGPVLDDWLDTGFYCDRCDTDLFEECECPAKHELGYINPDDEEGVEDEDDLPDEISDQAQFSNLPVNEEIDAVAVTKTRDGNVKAEFTFEDGLSEYEVIVEMGPDGAAVAKVSERAVAPAKDDNDHGC